MNVSQSKPTVLLNSILYNLRQFSLKTAHCTLTACRQTTCAKRFSQQQEPISDDYPSGARLSWAERQRCCRLEL